MATDWFNNAEYENSENNIETFGEHEVARERNRRVEEHLKKGGTSYTERGRVEDTEGMRDAIKRINAISESGPPLSNEMIHNSHDYYEYMDSVVTGKPMQKKGYFGGATFPGMAQGGMQPYHDPLNSPSRIGIPTWNEDMPEEEREELQRLSRSWCKWYYRNHPIVPTCLNIYARYPFVGMDIQCPDPVVEEGYKEVFFDQLKYHDLLPKAALWYWMVGEAPMFGRWNESYGAWIDERLINPDHIKVITWPGPEENIEAYFWQPPEGLRAELEEQDMEDPIFLSYLDKFGDKIYDWMEGKPSELPPDLFSMIRHDQDIDGNRGYPLLMRAFGELMKEEKLNQAMTAVADRLYTPFIVAKLGSDNLLQGQYPWMPKDTDIKKMQAHLEMVMSSKYRVMVYHSGIEFENPFAGQTIPNLNEDFDRATKNIMGVFGIPPELIYGGSQGTYASGALSAEIMMQNLSTCQQVWSEWWLRERAQQIAEARGYYAVERKGLTYTRPMERVVRWDPVRQEEVVEDRRKLMLPSIRFETMDWRDQESTLRNLLQIKQQLDAPIPTQHFVSLIDPNLNLETAREQYAEERISDYEMKQALGPAAEMGPQGPGGPGGMGPGGPPPGGGPGGPGGPGGSSGGPPGPGAPGDINGPNPNGPPGGGDRPPQSDEQRQGEPQRMSSLNRPRYRGYFDSYGNFHSYEYAEEPRTIRAKLSSIFSKEKTANMMITSSSYGDDYDSEVSTTEQRDLDAKFAGMTSEERETRSEHFRRYKQGELDPSERSYAESHMFTHFRSTGNKTGTLYSLDGNSIKKRRVK